VHGLCSGLAYEKRRNVDEAKGEWTTAGEDPSSTHAATRGSYEPTSCVCYAIKARRRRGKYAVKTLDDECE